eukprot:1253276-Pleurochrysis_carterae.AAC.1
MGEGRREGRAERNGSGRLRRPLMKRKVTLRTTDPACRMRTATCRLRGKTHCRRCRPRGEENHLSA